MPKDGRAIIHAEVLYDGSTRRENCMWNTDPLCGLSGNGNG